MEEVARTRVRSGRSARALFGLAAAIGAAGLLCASAQAAPRSFYGLIPNGDLGAGDYRLIDQANVGSARLPVGWAGAEPGNNQFNWSGTDRLIGGLAAANVRTLPVLYGTPGWLANNPAKPPLGSKRRKAEWREFVGEAVKRYGTGGTYWNSVYPREHPGATPLPVKAWQVWNEVNGPKHFRPRPNVGKYAQLLKLAKKGIKQQDRRAKIVTSGLVSKPTGKGGIKGWKYLRKLLNKKRAKRSLDPAALHPYAPNARQVFKDVKKMRRALKKGGKRKAQTWVTEVGWSSDRKGKGKLAKSPEKQAKLLKQTYKRLARKRKSWNVGGVYWYTWRDDPRASQVCRWCPTAGLVDEKLRPKPAFKQFGKVAR